MKFDITRQQVFPSLLTLFFMSVIGAIVLCGDDYISNEMIESDSLLGGYITAFQHAAPIWSALIASSMLFVSCFRLGRRISVQNIYSDTTSIHIPLLGVVGWCMILTEEFLLATLIFTLSSLAVDYILHAVRNGRSLTYLLNVGIALSILPLLYTPLLVMWVGVILSLILLDVTFREWIVCIMGLLLAPAITLYILWLLGDDFMEAPRAMAQMFLEPSTLFELSTIPLFRTAITALTTILALLSALWFKDNLHKTTTRLQISLTMLCCALLSLAIPSASLLSLSAAAPMIALLASLSLVRLRGWITNVAYFMLLLLLLLALFIPLYLPLVQEQLPLQ
ncbi:MAG: hypothetical protein SNH73_04245 [Rikenellaceae bacterium]